ncbi:hypothetical protein ACFP3Q_18210 [Nocardioides sp. GCM10027113]|uniref:hypothetical protein n=1 Tax=unclassified Nocardioides TaxID=2615069 RepID=UPI003623749E
MPRRVALVAAVALVALVAGGAGWWWLTRPQTELARAVALAPADSERLTFTHWSAVREELDPSLSADSSTTDLARFLDRGFDADLTSTSALLQSAEVMQRDYGFSPASLEWELLSQSRNGAVVVMRPSDDVDLEEVGDRLEDLGYERPEEDDGVWRGGGDVLALIDPSLTPELQYLVLDAGAGLVLASDTAAHLGDVSDRLGDEGPGDALVEVAEASGDAVSAVVYDGAYACTELSMTSADRGDQAEAEELVAAAGEVNPLAAYAMAVQPGGDVRVAMGFESDEQARSNADSRAALAAGPAPGQGGTFADRFQLGAVTAEGTTVTMRLAPVEGGYVMSDLSAGPVLFATC